MDLSRIRELVTNDESMLFNGCFNESTVRFDLSTRREKRNFYIEAFNRYIDDHRAISSSMEIQSRDAALVEKSKKCQKEASRLLDIVYEY